MTLRSQNNTAKSAANCFSEKKTESRRQVRESRRETLYKTHRNPCSSTFSMSLVPKNAGDVRPRTASCDEMRFFRDGQPIVVLAYAVESRIGAPQTTRCGAARHNLHQATSVKTACILTSASTSNPPRLPRPNIVVDFSTRHWLSDNLKNHPDKGRGSDPR